MYNPFKFSPAAANTPSLLLDRMLTIIWILSLAALGQIATWLGTYFHATLDPKYFSPLALCFISKEGWEALGLTAAATIFGFVFCFIAGFVLGLIGAMLAQSTKRPFRVAALAINITFDAVYVIPIVVTLSLVFAILFPLTVGKYRWILPIGGVIAATTVLGGYQVFKSVFNASTLPADRDRTLVDALYCMADRLRIPILGTNLLRIIRAMRLRDMTISEYTEAIRRAFHLSLVSVVIVEAVRPSIYEYIFAQTDTPLRALGGVGWIILSAQNEGRYDTIIGLIWGLFLFDFIFVLIIDAILYAFFTRHATRR